MKVELKGVQKLLQNIDKANKQAMQAAKRAMYTEAQLAMTEAKLRCPIEDGVLRSSGKVGTPVAEGRNMYVELSFGGAASAYAIAVHEHLSVHSPPSWKIAESHGNGVQWHTPGTGPKFLESVLNERKPEMRDRLARRIKADLGDKIGY
jgi:hypothetical protein